jgi:hypothetical protein
MLFPRDGFLPAPQETAQRIEEASMKQHDQIDQKKGSADRSVTGSKQGLPGGDIGRNSMAGKDSATKSDYGGSEGNSRERKSSRSGSDSDES